MLNVCDACETKFFTEFVLRRAPTGRSIDLHAGGLIAAACESIRKDFYCAKLPLDECYFNAFTSYQRNWPLNLEPKEGSYKDFTNCWCAVEAYFQNYPPDRDYFQPYIKADGQPAVEFRFAVPLPIPHPISGQPLFFAGRADMLAQSEPGSCYVLDEKTTKGIGYSWKDQWAMRGQFYGYTWAAREYGFPCVGAVIRGIGIQQTQYAFAEAVQLYTKTQLDRWKSEMLLKVQRMVDNFSRMVDEINSQPPGHEDLRKMHNNWRMSFGDACSSYGGCQYVPLCLSDTPWEIYQHMDQRVWEPMEQDPSKNSEDTRSLMGEITLAEFLGGEGGQ